MKISKFLAILCVVTLLAPIAALAGNPSKRGTAGAYELLLPVGARGTALGGTATASMTGVEAISWNPAGLSRGWGSASVEGLFSHMNYVADISLQYAAIGVSTGELGHVALSLRSVNFGDIQETTEDYPDGTGRTFSPGYLTLGVTYSKALTDRISVGFTGKFVNETILRASASGFALDAGVIYYVGGQGPLQGLHFGVALKNIGTKMAFTGEDLQRNVVPPNSAPNSVEQAMEIPTLSFEMPSSFAIGVGYDIAFGGKNRLTAMTEFENLNFGNDRFKFGGEYAFSEIVFLRGGFQTQDADNDKYIFGGTLGAGLSYDMGGLQLALDYAYQSTETFKGTNTFALRLKF